MAVMVIFFPLFFFFLISITYANRFFLMLQLMKYVCFNGIAYPHNNLQNLKSAG